MLGTGGPCDTAMMRWSCENKSRVAKKGADVVAPMISIGAVHCGIATAPLIVQPQSPSQGTFSEPSSVFSSAIQDVFCFWQQEVSSTIVTATSVAQQDEGAPVAVFTMQQHKGMVNTSTIAIM